MYTLDKYTKYIFSPCLPTPHPPKWKPMVPSWVRTPEYLEIEIGAFRTPEYSVYLRWHTLIDGNSLQPIENENNRQWTTLRPTNERLSHTTMHKTIIHCTTSVVTSYASCLVRNQLSLNQPLWRHDPRRDGWSIFVLNSYWSVWCISSFLCVLMCDCGIDGNGKVQPFHVPLLRYRACHIMARACWQIVRLSIIGRSTSVLLPHIIILE